MDILEDKKATVYIHRAEYCWKYNLERKQLLFENFQEIAKSFTDNGVILSSPNAGIGSTAYVATKKTPDRAFAACAYLIDENKTFKDQVLDLFKQCGPGWFINRRFAVVLKIPNNLDVKDFTIEKDGKLYIDPKFVVCVIGRTDDINPEFDPQILDNTKFYDYEKLKEYEQTEAPTI